MTPGRTLRLIPRHLRWRLVVGFTVTVALLVALLTVTESIVLERTLVQSVKGSLETTIRHQVIDGYERKLQDSNSAAQLAKVTSSVPAIAQSLATQDQPAVLLDGHGHVLSYAGTLSHDHRPGHPLLQAVVPDLVQTARSHLSGLHGPWSGQVTTPDGPYLLVLWPTHVDVATNGRAGLLIPGSSTAAGKKTAGPVALPPHVPTSTLVVALARGLQDSKNAVQTATTINLLVGFLAVALAIVISLVIVRAALRPLASVTVGAERLAAGTYDHRLALAPGADEIGRLVGSFNRMAAAISAAFAAQRRFVADASHELRTPLTALRGYTDVLQLGVGENRETAERVLQAMQEDLGRMSRLVDDLLSLARLDTGTGLRQEPVALSELLAAAAQEASVLARDTQCIQLDPVPQDLAVRGDYDRLRQVLSNVVANACSYCPGGSIIGLRAAACDQWAVITVRDTGPGIPAPELARLGEPFYRGDAARSRQTGGAGLGLAIARSIVEGHSGELSIASTLGVGTTVTIRLPRVASSVGSAQAHSHSAE